MTKVSLVMCNDMHMDIEQANELLSLICQNSNLEVCSDYTEADIIVIMTCAFGTGKKYSMYVISDVLRNRMNDAQVIVTGCLVKLNSEELKAIPGICVKAISEVKEYFGKANQQMKLVAQNRVIISSGCLKRCSYCVYPLIAGNYVSKSIDEILEEVEKLYQSESTIYISGGLETSDYGIDLYGKRVFPELLDKICTNFPNSNYVIGWFHPAGLTGELFSVISKHKNIAEIMVHIQHVNPEILRNMNRPSFEFTDERIRKLKELAPNLVISTEVIVGFPGETNKEFQELIDYLDLGLFQDIGVASYEPVIGTKAAMLKDLSPLHVRNERMEYISRRYNCTTYPSMEEPFEPILKSYFEAWESLNKVPCMVQNPEVRQKYQYLAGVDTKVKMPEQFGMVLTQIYEDIVNARDELAIAKMKKYVEETYTMEFRQFVYRVMEQSNLKPLTLLRAKTILL